MSGAQLKQTAFSFSAKKDMAKEDFMVSECNKTAFMMIESWPNWNSFGLIIYGPKGCGKTHLAHIFRDKLCSETQKPLNIPFYDCKQITMKNLERICNFSDAIIIENLQKNVDQEALFHLFNHFQEKGKYMLLTAEITPTRISFSLKDLQSRLCLLPVAEIKEPDDTMLRALIIKLFYDRQLVISPEILEYIINNTERSFAFAEKLVQEIDEISLAYKSTVNYKIVRLALENLNNSSFHEPDLFINL